MAKYSYEFKKRVVQDYLNGEGGHRYLARKYNVPNECMVQRWIDNYKAFGDDALRRSRKKENYSFERKLAVVELYLSSELSYRELAIQEGITNSSMIANWVNRFRAAGPEALRAHQKDREKTLRTDNTGEKPLEPEIKSIDTSAEHVKELEDELLRLRIENAFLKEMRRLRLEDEEKMRERPSSSAPSEENSD